ncbi:glycosyltransferase family 4 protein [Bernardetia sp.]|uniref:glycosyltransferase family 4 protein n=1 Tax=Bernardetia sp. TaxID=1937974 RepID=UPI0025BF9634|nr:glycosyltransferase family 4 protein [Bernardetia sp.]
MKVLHAHPGTGIFVRQTAFAYYEHNMLEKFCTTFIAHKEYFLSNFLKKIAPSLEKDIEKKAISEIPFEKIKTYPYRELIRLFASRYASTETTDKVWEWAENSYDRWVAGQIKKSNIEIFHGYEHCSLAALKAANSKQIMCVYEQPSVYYKSFDKIIDKLFKEENEFKKQYNNLFSSDLSKERNQRREEELHLASTIICNSTFTKNSFPAIYQQKAQVIPLAFPKPKQQSDSRENIDKVIFAISGNISYLKGAHHVLRVWKKLDKIFSNVELRIIGTYLLDDKEKQELPPSVKFYDRLAHQEYMNFIKEVSIFVSFTYSDGFGMVISEAMANGIPVIATPNCMALDFIEHNENGWIVPVGDQEALLQQMKWCVENKHLIENTSRKALETAEKWQWEDYRNKVAETIKHQYLLYEETKNRK